MTDPFDLLRDAGPPRTDSPPPIDRLWARLDQAPDGERRPSAAVTYRRVGQGRWRTSVATAACIAVTLAVTVGAITLL